MRERERPLMALGLFGTRSLELCNGAATGSPKEQEGTTIGWSHLPKLRPEALVIRVPFTPTFPRKLIKFTRTGTEPLNLQIELGGVLEAPATGPLALAGSGAAAELGGGEGGGEEEEEGEEVREGEGGREEEGEGVEDVGEIGGEEEGAGEEDKEEDQEVQGGGRGVLAVAEVVAVVAPRFGFVWWVPIAR